MHACWLASGEKNKLLEKQWWHYDHSCTSQTGAYGGLQALGAAFAFQRDMHSVCWQRAGTKPKGSCKATPEFEQT